MCIKILYNFFVFFWKTSNNHPIHLRWWRLLCNYCFNLKSSAHQLVNCVFIKILLFLSSSHLINWNELKANHQHLLNNVRVEVESISICSMFHSGVVWSIIKKKKNSKKNNKRKEKCLNNCGWNYEIQIYWLITKFSISFIIRRHHLRRRRCINWTKLWTKNV